MVGRRMPQANGISIAGLMTSRGAFSRSSRSATSYIGDSQLSSDNTRAPRRMRRTASAASSNHTSKAATMPAQTIDTTRESDALARAGADTCVAGCAVAGVVVGVEIAGGEIGAGD